MSVNLAVILDQSENSGLSAAYQYKTDSYGYTLTDYYQLFDQPLISQNLKSLSEFCYEDTELLQETIEGMESVGIDASKDKERLAKLKDQKKWHLITDGLLSVAAAMRLLDSPPPEFSLKIAEESLEELSFDLNDALEILQRAQRKGGKHFRLMSMD